MENEVIQSDILSEEEVNNLLNDTPVTEVDNTQLPSETKEEGVPTQEELLAAYNKLKELEAPKEETKEVPANVVEDFTKRYTENGGFTEQDYKDLAEKGYSKEFVDTYVEGVQAKELKAFETELTPYGKLDEFNSAVQWASENWSKDQIETFNKAITQSDVKTQAFIAGSLIKEMKLSNTQPPKPNAPIHSNTSPKPVSSEGYATKSDMVKDMNDSRYHSDPAYRAKVEAKLLASDTSVWYQGLPKGDY